MAAIRAKLMHELDESIVAVATGVFGVAVAVTGILWHGLLRQPSMMNAMYPNFWGSPVNFVVALVGGFVLGAFYGWLFAVVYNWVLKSMK